MSIRVRNNGLQIDVSLTTDGQKIRYRETFHGKMAAATIREAVIKAALMEGKDPSAQNDNSKAGRKKSKKSKKKSKVDTRQELPLEATLESVWGRYWKGNGQEVAVRSHMRQAVDFFGPDTCIRTIKTVEIDEYIDAMRGRGLAPSTIHGRCAALSKMFRHCVNRGLLKEMPFFDMPPVGDNSRHRFLSLEEEQELLTIMRVDWDSGFKTQRSDRIEGSIYVSLFEFLLDTGVRPIEARDVKMKNLNGRLLTLIHTKNTVRRTVPLTVRALAALKRLAEHFGDEPLAWATASRITRGWNFARDQMGLAGDKDFVPYCLRHTCATRLYDKTRDLLLTKEWLGHKTIQITLRYAQLQPDDLEKACDLMQAQAA